MNAPETANDLLRLACRLTMPKLVEVLGLATYGYAHGAVFRCPRCRRDAAYAVSSWAWTCCEGCRPGTVVDLALMVAQEPQAVAALLRSAEVT